MENCQGKTSIDCLATFSLRSGSVSSALGSASALSFLRLAHSAVPDRNPRVGCLIITASCATDPTTPELINLQLARDETLCSCVEALANCVSRPLVRDGGANVNARDNAVVAISMWDTEMVLLPLHTARMARPNRMAMISCWMKMIKRVGPCTFNKSQLARCTTACNHCRLW